MRHGLLVLGVCSLHACDVEMGKPSAEREWASEGHALRLVAQGVDTYGVGIDGVGAPHAIGCLWPRLEKEASVEIRLSLDDRPEVVVYVERVPELSQAAVDAVLAVYEVEISPQGGQLAWSSGEAWTVLEVLTVGPPFAAGQSLPAGTPAFATLLSPELATAALLADPDRRGGDEALASWDAVALQPVGPPWDGLALEAWPEARGAYARVERLAPPGSGVTGDWRVLAEAKAMAYLPGPAHVAAIDLLLLMEAPVPRMDAYLLANWPRDTRRALPARLDRLPAPSEAWQVQAVTTAVPLIAGDDDLVAESAAELLLHLDGELYQGPVAQGLLARRPLGWSVVHVYEEHPRRLPPDACPAARAAILTNNDAAVALDAVLASAGLCQGERAAD